MKHSIFFAILLTLLPAVMVAQEVPEDRYIAIYDLIQQADGLTESGGAGNAADAQAKYSQAQTSLKKFQDDFPAWNVKIVNFRLNYLATKLNKPATAATETPPVANKATALVADPDNQVKALQDQLRRSEADKAVLENKVKEIASANTAQALAQTRAQLQSLQDENKSLKTSLKSQPAKSVPTVDAATMERISQNLTEARQRLEAQNKSIAALNQEKELLQKRLDATASKPADTEISALQAQIQKVEADKAALQDKLQAAQTAQKTMVDAKLLASTEDRLKELQKENNLLRAGMEEARAGTIQLTNATALDQMKQSLAATNQKLQEQFELATKLAREKDALQKQLDASLSMNATAKELTQTKKDFTLLKRKYYVQTEAAVILIAEANIKMNRLAKVNTGLTQQNSSLQKQLNSLASNAKFVVEGLKNENETLRKTSDKRKTSSASAEPSADFIQLQSQLSTLRAKLSVLEAQPVPFSSEELALFRKPETASLTKEPVDKKSKTKLPAAANELIAEAQRLFAAHDYEQAEQKYLEVLKLDAKNVYTLGNLATIELEMDKLGDAETHLQQALTIKPDDAFSLGALGNLRFRQGKYDAALDALSHAAQLNPNDAEIQNFLGVTLSQKGQRAAAETALRKALQLDPQYGSAHNNLAVIYLTQNPPQVELARWHYQKALSAGQARNADLEKMLEVAAKAPATKP